jgi:uncharacterized membrane protein
MKKHKKITTIITDFTISIFLNGLFAILPLAITLGLITFVLKLITSWLDPLKQFIAHYLNITFPYIELLLLIIFIFLVGTILKIFLLRTIARGFESLIARIPIIRQIYGGTKQLVHAMSFKDEASFKKVVLVEFPRKGIYSLGFVTSEVSPILIPVKKDRHYNVFIPTTPNPTTGFFIIVSEGDLEVIDITRQEAMTMIISGGIIQPKR